MHYLAATATRCVDDHDFPAVIEFRFAEADGTTVTIIEKAPVVADADDLTSASAYPAPVRFGCRITGGERDVADIVLAHHVEDEDGRTEFRVRGDQLTLG